MRVLKTKTFARWARKERLGDTSLRAAVEEMRRGLVDARLGGNLVKKRIARPGAGKSGGYRTLLATDLHERWVFLFGFAKSDRDDVDDDELLKLLQLARVYVRMDDGVVKRAVEAGELMEVDDGESQVA